MSSNVKTITGNRGLQLEQPLIFEQGAQGRSGVDLAEPQTMETRSIPANLASPSPSLNFNTEISGICGSKYDFKLLVLLTYFWQKT